METVRGFFILNRHLVLFVYGLTFFVMGLAIFLQSRRYSRLRLARDLRWLAAFGILHGLHEWGDTFIPLQATYMPRVAIELLLILKIFLLALSFLCLMMFGAVTLERPYPWLRKAVFLIAGMWVAGFWIALYADVSAEEWISQANIWARYLLGLTGGLMAAYGLYYQARTDIAPLNIPHIYRALRVAGWSLVAYAIFGGLMVPEATYFPASLLNKELIERAFGVPIEVLRSLTGMVMAVSIIRALEIFEIELDTYIGDMEADRIQAAERERIGQEIHDGAIQGVYSASLILESTDPLTQDEADVTRRLRQAQSVLNAVNQDLRSYMVSLRTKSEPDPLIPSLRRVVDDPRYRGMLDIELNAVADPALKPMQVHQILAIVQECLANTLRHARARRVTITVEAYGRLLTVRVEDDGRGFSPEDGENGYGIRSMKDRARLLGGQLDIASAPGKGTVTTFTLAEEKL